MRRVPLANNECYHIYNRGVEKRDIFSCEGDYLRFLKSMKAFNTDKPIGSIYERYFLEKKGFGHPMSKIVEIIAYCLNPNHYHFILRQIADRGIEKFMQRVGNGYTKYFNHKYDRSGFLFQGKFKSIHINSNSYLLYLSAYVNENHFVHGLGRSSEWKYSSFSDYIGKTNWGICEKEIILDQFDNDYKQYTEFSRKNALYLKNKKEEKYLLE
ncbi:MAG: transposase [Parcubacteria group bacterium]